jgi:hypothetical protein
MFDIGMKSGLILDEQLGNLELPDLFYDMDLRDNGKTECDASSVETGQVQSIKNPYNLALEIVAEAGRPIAVFAAGPLFPQKYYDKVLAEQIGDAEQAFNFGAYTVMAMGKRPPLKFRDKGSL